MWLSNPGCEEVVQAAWRNTDEAEGERNVLAKIKKCGKDLNWWNKNVFRSVWKELEHLRKILPKVKNAAMVTRNNDWVRKIKKEIEVSLARKETMWAQRSRLLWAKQGDRITKYFHSCATKRYYIYIYIYIYLIEWIRDEDEVWRELPEDITMVLVNYYKSLFSSTNQTMSQVVLEYVPSVITKEMNLFLSRDFDTSEVATALHSKHQDHMACPTFLLALLEYDEPRCHIIHFRMVEFRYLVFAFKSYLYISHP